MKLSVYTKEAEGKKFFYVYVGREFHYRPTYIMWISKDLIQTDEEGRLFIQFPVIGCDIKQGKKESTLILKKGNLNMYYYMIECGYRGSSYIDKVFTGDDEQTFTYFFDYYHSERGNLGISRGVLALTKSQKIRVSWHRDGRLYGAPASGVTILYSDGKIEQLTDTDLEELAELQEEKV